MKTVLITGGAGFIGSNLADRLLEENYEVIIIDNMTGNYSVNLKNANINRNINHPHYHFYKVDIRNKEEMQQIFKENTIDSVIHLAGLAGVRKSIEEPILYEEVNGIGTQNILEVMKENKVKNLVFSSSSSVYGNRNQGPFKESDNTDYPISPYAATKKADELFIYTYHHLYKINAMLLRFFTVYGPRQRGDLAISKFVKAIFEDEPIQMYGDGTTSRDYTYIGDIIDGIWKSLKYLEKNEDIYEILNIGESTPITLKDMIKTIETKVGKKAKILQMPMQMGDVTTTYASIEKAKNMIGYAPKTSFEEGIEKFVKWFKENKDLYD